MDAQTIGIVAVGAALLSAIVPLLVLLIRRVDQLSNEVAQTNRTVAAGAIAIANADPERIQMSYEWATSDELSAEGLEASLVGDLRLSLLRGLENKAIDDV